jgi:glycosyltransferase involved in cell wall biosynthesis
MTAPNTPTFSVVTPVHNCSHYLRATLQSVLVQDLGPERMQMAVIDDASSDQPDKVVEELGRGRVEYVRPAERMGPCKAFNTCVQHARGEFVHLLHGDDLVLPGFYERVLSIFRWHPEVGMYVSRVYEIDERGRRVKVLGYPGLTDSGVQNAFYDRLVPFNHVRTPSVVIPKRIYDQLGAYDLRLNHTQDWNMWLRVAGAFPIYYDDELVAEYRWHQASDSVKKLENGVYLVEYYNAVDFWLQSAPPANGRVYRDRITEHVLNVAETDVKRHPDRATRVALIRGLFEQHSPALTEPFLRRMEPLLAKPGS